MATHQRNRPKAGAEATRSKGHESTRSEPDFPLKASVRNDVSAPHRWFTLAGPKLRRQESYVFRQEPNRQKRKEGPRHSPGAPVSLGGGEWGSRRKDLHRQSQFSRRASVLGPQLATGDQVEVAPVEEGSPIEGVVVYCEKSHNARFFVGLKFHRGRIPWRILQR